jgi:UDP-N-acetylglucosamine 2-epimerase (non-hydrolysing)
MKLAIDCNSVDSKRQVNVYHLETGLKSFDRTMPEKINRVVTYVLAEIFLISVSDAY